MPQRKSKMHDFFHKLKFEKIKIKFEPKVLSYLIIFLCVLGFLIWSLFVPLARGAHAPGKLMVESNKKSIQHYEGGIVEKIFINEGKIVKKDEPLIQISTLKFNTMVNQYSDRVKSLMTIKEILSKRLEALLPLVLDGFYARAQYDDMQREYAKISTDLVEAQQQLLVAKDSLSRTTIFSPVNGQVTELQVHTIGGVINASQTLMHIVPLKDSLIAEAYINPLDADTVVVGQIAEIRLSALPRRNAPLLYGKVLSIANDSKIDPDTKKSTFLVRVEIEKDELKKVSGYQLISGMPLDVMIKAGERTAFEYFIAPWTDLFRKSMHEE
jgi:multidrug efflux pump subunit AcrA (membrane-fusion protein)